MKKKKITKYIVAALLLIALLLILTPLFWCISLSFDRRALTNLPAFSLIPHEPSLFNYQAAWNTIPPKRPSILSSFLGRITRNFAISNLRKKYAAKRADMYINNMNDILREVEILNQQTIHSLEHEEAEEELVRLLNEFLETLKERDRDIFLRRYWHMDSMEELAKRHDLSESAVKANLFRTRKKLEKIMRKEKYLK